MKTVKIDEKNLEDALDLEKGLALYESHFDKKIKVDGMWRKNLRKLFKKRLKDKKFFGIMVEEQGKHIALLTGWLGYKEIWREDVGYLCDVYVKPRHRKKGIAKKMIREFVKWLKKKGVSDLELDVYSDNGLAKKAWKALGFSPYNIRMKKKI